MSGGPSQYLHGFTADEQQRLLDQAQFIAPMIYPGIDFAGCEHILEIGCGVGAQTQILLHKFPGLRITGIEISATQIARANEYLGRIPEAMGRFELFQQDAHKLVLNEESFDGAFLCWILEHVEDPRQVLKEAYRVLRPGAKIFINEVMNFTFFLFPQSESIGTYWQAFNRFQAESGGDPFIGAKLGGFLKEAGFHNIVTSAKTLNLDRRDPKARLETLRYWCDLLLSGAAQLEKEHYISKDLSEKVRREFLQLEEREDAVMYFAFMQASAQKV